MRLQKIILSKLVYFVIALQVLNMSIDSPNAITYKSSDDINYIDTYVEYIAEVLLKYHNVIPEAAKKQHKQLHHKACQLICSNIRQAVNYFSFNWQQNKTFLSYTDQYAYQFSKEISPPPKFSC